MGRKKKKAEHEDAHDEAAFTAAVSVLTGAWHIAQKFGVCPICLMFQCADMAEEAEKDGRIKHGVIPEDEQFIHMTGRETMQ